MEPRENCDDPETPSCKCSNWSEIVSCLEEFPSLEVRYDEGYVTRTGWVFRGLTDSCFCLEPSIERQARSKSMPWFALQQLIALEFQSRAHMHFSPTFRPEHELTWLAQMQHYGIPTRLLDFTYSPFVALYFAIREQYNNKQRSDVRLWAIDETAVNDRFKQVVQRAKEADPKKGGSGFKVANSLDSDSYASDEDVIISEIRELPLRIAEALRATRAMRRVLEQQGSVAVASPPAFNPRLASQQGVFLVNCAEGLSFGKSLKVMMESHKAIWCKRFDISTDAIPHIEQKLFRMNIHEQSLFPDMEGLAGFIRQKSHHAPAVDVAWFANDEHLYPLMIFEIESSATNAMAGNPAKVFGQSNEKFERPLFFFHLIVRSGINTSRVDSLKGLFGSHNYRTYQLDRGMGTTLVKDILSQHRRIRNTVDIHSLLSVLMTSSELAADSDAILAHAATIGLRGAYLADTASLAGQHPEARALFLNHLCGRFVARKWFNIDTGYRSWLGHNWSRPIHLGLLSATRPSDRAQILEQLRSWQEHSSFMPSAIGPHFGLSLDYDHFIFGAAAGLWALVASLMLEQPEALTYISEQLTALVRGFEHARPFAWPYSITWGLHVAASAGNPAGFDVMRSFANERGGIAPRILYDPPAFLYIDDYSWHETVTQSPELVPQLNDFLSRRVEAVRHITRVDPVDLALSALGCEEGPDVDGASLVKLLTRGGPARKEAGPDVPRL